MPPELLTCGVQLQELDCRRRNGKVNVARVGKDGTVAQRAKRRTIHQHVFALEAHAGEELVKKQHDLQVDVRAAGLVGGCAAVVQGAIDDWTLDLSAAAEAKFVAVNLTVVQALP